MRTPEGNWERTRGLVAGPGIAMLIGIAAILSTKDAFATGSVVVASI